MPRKQGGLRDCSVRHYARLDMRNYKLKLQRLKPLSPSSSNGWKDSVQVLDAAFASQ